MKHITNHHAIIITLITILVCSGCSVPRNTFPIGDYPKQVVSIPEPDAAAAEVPEGYRVEVFMKDLIWPSSIEFDEAGNIYVAESGCVYGDPFAPAQILRITQSGEITRYASGFMGPVTDLLWHKHKLFVSHRGKISIVQNDGIIKDIVTGLPSHGDHFNNEMSVGPDGKIYFGQGTATNSGVVGLDNAYPYVWLLLHSDVHDVPAKDIQLTNESFLTPQPNNVLSRQGSLLSLGKNVGYAVQSIFNRKKDKSLLVRTRAFQAFGEKSRQVKGEVKSSGTILRMNDDGSGLEVYAWGLRNPYGVQWSPDGILYVTDNAYDERGSRPIANAKDNIFQVQQDGWYGFPDFSSGIPVTDPQFRPARGPKPKLLLDNHPPVGQPWLVRPENAAATKFDFSTSSSFGFEGQIFLAEFGSGTPLTAADSNSNGYTVVKIDPKTKENTPFLSNKSKGPQGEEFVLTAGPRHPVEAEFSNDGEVLYVVDIGAIGFKLASAGPFPTPYPGTGVIWRITKNGHAGAKPPAGLSPMVPRSSINK